MAEDDWVQYPLGTDLTEQDSDWEDEEDPDTEHTLAAAGQKYQVYMDAIHGPAFAGRRKYR